MSISHNTRYPIDQIDTPPANIDNVPEVEGRKYILATWARSDTASIGHIIPVDRHEDGDQQENAYYVGSSGRFTGNHYRGVPLNAPAAEGGRIMLIDPPGVNIEWAVGTTEFATRTMTAGILRADSTSSRAGLMVGESLYANHWVPLSSARQAEAPPEVFPVTGVQAWHGFPFEMLPQDSEGSRHVLVTDAARRPESRVGRIVQVTGDSGKWLISDTGDYVKGSPLNVYVTYGDRILALDGEASGKIGTVRDIGRSYPYFTPEGEEGQVQARRWVKMRNEDDKSERYRPRDTDTTEVAVLRAQALELHNRMESSVASLIFEASQRGWSNHLADVAQTAGLELPGMSYFARISANIVVYSYTRPTEEQREAAQRNYEGGTLGGGGSVAIVMTETLYVDLGTEVDNDSSNGGVTRQMVQGLLQSKRGYSTGLLDYFVSIGTGVR